MAADLTEHPPFQFMFAIMSLLSLGEGKQGVLIGQTMEEGVFLSGTIKLPLLDSCKWTVRNVLGYFLHCSDTALAIQTPQGRKLSGILGNLGCETLLYFYHTTGALQMHVLNVCNTLKIFL